MKEKVVGIDLGTGSLGILLRNLELGNNIIDQFEWFSVTTFNAGTGMSQTGEYTLASDRRAHIQSRRLKEHSRWKRWATLALLIEYDMCPMRPESLERWSVYDKNKNLRREYPIEDQAFAQWIKLDFDGDGVPEYSSPFQLRKELVEQQLDFSQPEDRYKLGRAIYHIAIHRGFKSSKGETLADMEEDGKNDEINTDDLEGAMKKSEEKKSKDLAEYMESHQLKTVGQAFAYLENEGIRIRNSRYQAVRSQNVEEIDEYFRFQEGLNQYEDLHKRLVSTKKEEGTLFYKLPLRSQKGHIGKCTFEKNKRRCPISHPEYEKYRAWSFINNIRYKTSAADAWLELSLDIKAQLYQEVFVSKVRKDFRFEVIRKFLEKQLGLSFENSEKVKTINYKDSTLVAGCPVTARLQNIVALFDTDLEHFEQKGIKTRETHTKRREKGKHIVAYYAMDLWNVCFDTDEKEDVKAFAHNSLGWDDNATDKLCKLWAAIDQGYTTLSLKAIRNINRMLVYGLKASDAIFLAKIPDITGMQADGIKELIDLYLNRIKGQVDMEVRTSRIANILIANYKSLPIRDRFADHDFNYQLKEDDKKAVIDCISANDKDFALLDANEQQEFIDKVANLYQSFFTDIHRDFIKSPRIVDVLKEELSKKYPDVDDKKWDKLYHPSLLSDFPRDKENANHLGSPNIGAIRNPTVLRTLNVLRKVINKMIDEGLIDPQETRLVVETTRVSNDINKRWAIHKYNDERRDENKAIEKILQEQYPEKDIDEADIDVARYVLEQSGEDLYGDDTRYQHQIKKYKLWLEQGCQCLYTGHIINLSNLLNGDMFDAEHTVPRSLSFDSSDKNLTLCDSYYNRHVKKNMIPSQLPNYEHDVVIDGHEYTAIKPRLEKWEEKVERLSKNVIFWKNKARRAQTESYKNTCTRQKLLWQMEYDYWRNKLDRFKMKPSDLTDGFRNSQLVDTGIITKYALLYLKTIFRSVDVQNGQSTSAFRKIFGIPEKDRSTHYHHAVDAAILSMIPSAAQRSRMLKLFYEIDEMKRGGHEYSGLQYQLNKEIESCGVGKGAADVDQYIEKHVLVDYYKQDRTLQDTSGIRGKLHAETFLGAITQWNGEEKKYVKRVELKFKKSSLDSGFKDWDDLEKTIVNKQLVQMMKSQFPEGTTFQEACEQGIYMLNKKGEKVNKIRHIRIEVKEKNPLAIKMHTYLSDKEYKQYYYAGMGDLYVMCEYQNQQEKAYQIYSLFSIAENRKYGVEDIPQTIIGKKGNRLTLSRVIKPGDMVLIYKDSPEELYDLDTTALSKRLYRIPNGAFESDGRISLCHHLCAKPAKGQSIKDYENLPQNIRCGASTIKFLQKDVDFTFEKGKIVFKSLCL